MMNEQTFTIVALLAAVGTGLVGVVSGYLARKYNASWFLLLLAAIAAWILVCAVHYNH